MRELKEAVLIVTVTKVVLSLMKYIRVHTPLKVVAFNSNGIVRWRYQLSKPLRELLTDEVPLSELYLKHDDRFFHQIIIFVGPAVSR